VATVALFHSTQGLRPAVLEGAERIRAGGHEVLTPDLFDGAIFDTIDEGIVKRDEIGVPGLIGRAYEAVAHLPADTVYAGFSLGAAAALYLTASRPGARAAITFHAAAGLEGLGVEVWPHGVPVQLHYAKDDPWVPEGEREAMASMLAAAGAELEQFAYPGEGHLFDDSGMPEYDADSTELLWARTLAFLQRA
jgi:dienelactone hydrolase